MSTPTFAEFQSASLAEGYDEVIERRWAPGQEVDTHTHPFTAHAVIVEGEMWLACGDRTQHLLPGDGFDLDAGVPHAERYGPAGAVYWVARRNAAAPR